MDERTLVATIFVHSSRHAELRRDPDLVGTLALAIYEELLEEPDLRVHELAERLHCSERAVVKNIRKLEEKGWLGRERQRGVSGAPNVYSFPRLALAS